MPIDGRAKPIVLIEAPSNLGLRPPRPGIEPGCWQAPAALRRAGLHTRLGPARIIALDRPAYVPDPPPGSTIRNAFAIRAFAEQLAEKVGEAFDASQFPLVLGGDCSILMGCLLAARRRGRSGLVHVDGHSDFRNPNNYDPLSRPGTAAGMDLALAVGLGEAVLSKWDGIETPLLDPRDAVQIGERENRDADYAFPDIFASGIEIIDIFTVQEIGVAAAGERALRHLARRGLDRFWLHVDLDVLDQMVMPAVDTPGSPGLGYGELSRLIRALLRSGRCIGAEITIFDPDLDATGEHAAAITRCLADAWPTESDIEATL